MATMGRYCKAYPIARFREFPNWPGDDVTMPTDPADGEPQDYLFLQESLVVTRDIFADEDVVFDRITPEWEAFCRDALNFAVPEDAIAANPR